MLCRCSNIWECWAERGLRVRTLKTFNYCWSLTAPELSGGMNKIRISRCTSTPPKANIYFRINVKILHCLVFELSHSQDFLKTSDLEVKVSEILTRSRFLSIWISCVASFSSYLHHKLECLPCPPTCQGYDNTQSGLYSWRVKMNFRISKSVLTEHNVFLQNTRWGLPVLKSCHSNGAF